MECRPQTLSLARFRTPPSATTVSPNTSSSNNNNSIQARRHSNMTYACVENGNVPISSAHMGGALRCASNPPADPKSRPKRDFRFQVIEVRQCPKWFIWPSNKPDDNSTANQPTPNSSVFDQENRQQSQGHIPRRLDPNQSETRPMNIQGGLPDVCLTPMSAPTARRLLTKASNPLRLEQSSQSVSPPSLSRCSNQSSFDNYQSSTFQILSVASKDHHDGFDSDGEEVQFGVLRSGRCSLRTSPDPGTPLAEPRFKTELNNN